MVASRWPLRPGRERAVFRNDLTSSPVRYSRGRTAALVGRRGATVRFSMVGAPFAFTRKALYFIGSVYATVRISVEKRIIEDVGRHTVATLVASAGGRYRRSSKVDMIGRMGASDIFFSYAREDQA